MDGTVVLAFTGTFGIMRRIFVKKISLKVFQKINKAAEVTH